MDEPVNENLEFESRLDLSGLSEKIEATRKEIGKKLVGQQKLVELVLAGILSDGHLLIEGVPGIAKTYMAKLVSRVIDATFSRIQFTPDLMPSDIIGTNIFNVKKSEFEFKKGPVFAHVILIDEINRSPAKTQSALFECMEERQVTADGTTYALEYPFIVLATQNPVEHEGTYRLPEAQLDRFLFKIDIGYPSFKEEVHILNGGFKKCDQQQLRRCQGDHFEGRVADIQKPDFRSSRGNQFNEIHRPARIQYAQKPKPLPRGLSTGINRYFKCLKGHCCHAGS
jgi:MoxR-like ATPase